MTLIRSGSGKKYKSADKQRMYFRMVFEIGKKRNRGEVR